MTTCIPKRRQVVFLYDFLVETAMKTSFAALLFLLTFPGSANTRADNAKDGVYLDAESAGADFEVQGEYRGVLDPDGDRIEFALQVIALGEHKFDAVAYYGGLPGDGWSRGDRSIDASGQTKDGVTTVTSDQGYAVIKDNSAVIYSADDEIVGTLTKVQRVSPTMGAKAPAGAIVLFDGTSADAFKGGKVEVDNLLSANCESKESLGDHTLHLEFRTPFKPAARGQARGNSGVYLQSRYECQVLDSFGLDGKNNECGGIYQIAAPAVNACLPPLSWQTYDIDFTSAVWKDGNKVSNARATIRHNGIVIHEDLELPHGTPGRQKEAEGPAPLYLQGHGNPVFYRNIWVVKK